MDCAEFTSTVSATEDTDEEEEQEEKEEEEDLKTAWGEEKKTCLNLKKKQ